MKKLISLLLAVALSATMVIGLTACGEKSGKNEIKVGLICLHGESSPYDANFINAFKAACSAKGLTDKDYSIVTGIPEDEQCYETACDLADSGAKAIFADSFGHEEFMIKAAKEYTNVTFCHATGTQSNQVKLANFHNAFASIYQGRYLAGYAAGLKLNTMKESAVSKVFTVGYVGAFTYAEVISGYTSWFLGVQAALEEGYTAQMKVQFTGSWYDEAGEKAAAETLIQSGCVLISQHADSMGAPTACDNATVPNVSYNGSTGKDTCVIYSKINWQPYFEKMIDKALNGGDLVTDYTGTLSDGMVYVSAADKAAAPGTDAALATVKAALIDGSLQVFDVSKFTVTVINNEETKLNTNATVDKDGHLTAYLADVDGDYKGDKNVVEACGTKTIFNESFYRSAPYFDLTIDGITLLNTKF